MTSTNKISFSIKSKNYSFLSTSYLSNFTIDDKQFYHIEGYYQTMKYEGFNEKAAEHIRNIASPQACRKAGTFYPVTDAQEIAWNIEKRIRIIKKATMAKFITNSTLADKLLDTGDAILLDTGSTDEFWGAGKTSTGTNMMGKILMEVRATIKFINEFKEHA